MMNVLLRCQPFRFFPMKIGVNPSGMPARRAASGTVTSVAKAATVTYVELRFKA